MKSVKSLFALLTLVTLSFACAPVAEQPTTQAANSQAQITVDQDAFPWDAADASCCEQRPILDKPKI